MYRPRDPQASHPWRLMDRHFETFQQVYDERFQAKYGYWRPIIEQSVTAYLRCGDLHEGFARVRVDPLCCPERGGQMKVVSFIEPPQADVIAEILKHCGLWQSRSPRAPPDVDELVLELDAAYLGGSIDSPGPADQSQELTYVDIDTFLESF